MNRIKTLILLSFLALFLTECQKIDDGSYVAPLTISAKLDGTWKITNFKLTDEIAKANSIKPFEMDLTSKLQFSTFTITFHVDKDSMPTTFETGGTAPALFLASGYWDLDTPFIHTDGTPTELLLYSDEAKTELADKLFITAVPGTKAEMEFRLVRLNGDTPYASYTYKLKLDQ
jgi:hypothetical protein